MFRNKAKNILIISIAFGGCITPFIFNYTTTRASAELQLGNEEIILVQEDSPTVYKFLTEIRKRADLTGAQEWEPYIPSLLERARKELGPERSRDEGFILYEIFHVLSQFGDDRALPVFFQALNKLGIPGGSKNIIKGLVQIGPSTIPMLIDSLNHGEIQMKHNVLVILQRMNENAPDMFSEENKNVIREDMLRYLSKIPLDQRVYRKRVVDALGVFGDESTIPVLQELAAQDAALGQRTPDGKAVVGRPSLVKDAAEKAIAKIRARLSGQQAPAEPKQ